MLKIIKDFLVPTERNQFLPHALSPASFVVYFVLTIILILSPAYVRRLQLATLENTPSFTGEEIVKLINASRVALSLPVLRTNPTLIGAANDKGTDIFTKQYFAHVSPENKTPWDFLRGKNYTYTLAGENLALDYPTATEAHVGFMNSPTHRANILNPLYTEVGVAVMQGVYNGQSSILVVEYFGRPKVKVAKATAPPPAKTTIPKTVAAPLPTLPAATSSQVATSSNVATTTPVNPDSITSTITTAIPMVTTTQAVLGAKIADNPVPDKTCIQTSFGMEWSCASTRAIAGTMIAVILFSLGAMFVKTKEVPFGVGVRSIVLAVILGYVSILGMDSAIIPHTTQDALALIELL
ncbi:MAG TPA: CAP domain-containing protein [Candidatus Paceibacterota bacterium]